MPARARLVAGSSAGRRSRNRGSLRLWDSTVRSSGEYQRSETSPTISVETCLRELVQQGLAEARKYGFSEVRQQTLLVVLMFAFGHGCTHDPSLSMDLANGTG